jgi:mannitol-specific phosphotransferase system IIBC component
MKYIRWLFDIIKIEIFFPYILMKEGEAIPPMDGSGDGDAIFDIAAPE